MVTAGTKAKAGALQALAVERWGPLVEVIYGCAGEDGRLKQGYWLREWSDATRQRFVRWGFLGSSQSECVRMISEVDDEWRRV